MSRNYLVQAHLEYLVEQGLKKGLTEKQAIDYANNIFFSKGESVWWVWFLGTSPNSSHQ